MSGINFQDLLQDAEQMNAQIDQENIGMPKLQRTLSQLYEAGRKKLAKTSNYNTSDTSEINASLLLSSKGIDAPKLTQTIQNLQMKVEASVPTACEQFDYDRASILDKLRDTDLETFLKSEKEAALMSIIDETKQQSLAAIEETFALSNQQEWDKQKQKIMLELLGSFNPELSIATATTINSRSSNNVPMQGRTLMSEIELAFANEVYNYNEKIIAREKPKPDLLANFVSLVRRLNDKNIEETWNMLSYMTNLPNNKSDDRTASDSDFKQYDRDNSIQTQNYFVSQAIKYLENCFRELLQSTVNSNLQQAKLGGAIGTLPLVSGYLRLPQSNKYHSLSDETFDDAQPLWPTIYLCIRCGDIEAARSVAIKTKKEDIASYLEEILRSTNANNGVIQRHLSVSSENKLKLEYKSKIKRIKDLYERAVYCYLCRYNGDDDSMNQVLDNVDDFLWFKLNTVVFTASGQLNTSLGAGSSATMSPENMTFQEFQAKLSIEYGERHFITNRNPFIYLQVLLLTAQFEMAIEFLLKCESMIVHAIHMAIALYERNLLNITKIGSNSQLIVPGDSNEPRCFRRINFPSLIRLYTRKFECTDPREALQYYFFLRNLRMPATQSQQPQMLDEHKRLTTYFAQYIKELALETREFELLFGRLEKNAIRRPGDIDRFISEEEASEIIGLVAEELESKGLIEESIKLFDLCKQHQRVLELCNKLISQVVTDVNISNSNRDRLRNMSTSIAMRYKTETSMTNSIKAIPKSIKTTFYLLNDLITFFDLFHSENWTLAYETLNRLSILPTNSSNVDPKVREFIAFSEEIKRNFPDLILAAMTILNVLYSKANISTDSIQMSKYGMSINDEKRAYLTQLKENAKALIKFVGCIPYRLSGEINARLLQLEVTMN